MTKYIMQELNSNNNFILIFQLSSIAPKCLTKSKLKHILKYQCETYEKLMKDANSYEVRLY